MTAPPTRPPLKMPPIARPPPPSAGSVHVAKTFAVKAWTGAGEGKKILLYGPNGMGKTTLASMAPNPIFIGFDDGGREIRNPKTGQPVNAIPGVETFEDFRDAMHQTALFPAGATLVVDTITLAEVRVINYLLRSVKTEKGERPGNIEDYGWGKGFNLLLDPMRLLLADMDALVRKGVNVILLAQQGIGTVVNQAGTDYFQDGPLLTSKPAKDANVRSEYIGWCDCVFRIGYDDPAVTKATVKSTKGKAVGETARRIFTEPEVYFVAKNRMNGTLPPVVSFDTRDDDSIWRFVFAEVG